MSMSNFKKSFFLPFSTSFYFNLGFRTSSIWTEVRHEVILPFSILRLHGFLIFWALPPQLCNFLAFLLGLNHNICTILPRLRIRFSFTLHPARNTFIFPNIPNLVKYTVYSTRIHLCNKLTQEDFKNTFPGTQVTEAKITQLNHCWSIILFIHICS